MAAIVRTLATRPDWSARFILSATDREPDLVRALYEFAAPFGGRIRIESGLPYAEVKAAWAKTAVGMVLTKTPEPFGRTALEALASGAALVTSGLGGLAEVCGPDALVVDPGDADAVAEKLAALMDSAGPAGKPRPRRPRPRRTALRHSNRGRADGRLHRGCSAEASPERRSRGASRRSRSTTSATRRRRSVEDRPFAIRPPVSRPARSRPASAPSAAGSRRSPSG